MEEKKIPTVEEIKEEIKQRMAEDVEVQGWFSQFNKLSWDTFIMQYSIMKHSAIQHPDVHVQVFNPKNKEFNDHARSILEHIQQKKLFNLQCQWRAREIELPFVKITLDFELLEKCIMDCPFLPPVTQEEVELYIEYMQNEGGELFDNLYYNPEWQNYRLLHDEDRDYMPDWYVFYDQKMGTGDLMDLPDLRGEKEMYYSQLAHKSRIEENRKKQEAEEKPKPEAQPATPVTDVSVEIQKPSLYISEYKYASDFVKRFEDENLFDSLLSYLKYYRHVDEYEDLDEEYEYLKLIPEPLGMIGHSDWREALRLTVRKYKVEKYSQALRRVWRHYWREVGDPEAWLLRRLGQPDFDFERGQKFKFRDIIIEDILCGRELAGEPRDLDF